MPKRRAAQPLRLRAVLERHGVEVAELAAALDLSRSTLSTALSSNRWPRRLDERRQRLKAAAEQYLIGRGVTAAELADGWLPAPKTDEPRGGANTGAAQDPNDIDVLATLAEAVMLSQQARAHFSLPRDPFADDVTCAEDVFWSQDQRYIREVMWHAARHGGFVAVVGESGSGKSVLRRDLIDRVVREDARLVLIQPQTVDKARLTAAAICDAIIADLGGRPRAGLEGKARECTRVLTASLRAGNAHVLMIEEAHDLSISTLKYLKRFWELEDGFRRLLGIVLVGQPELRRSLDEREHYDAREVIRRIEVAELRPLDYQLEDYLAHKLRRVGVEAARVFGADAYDAIRDKLTRRGRGFGAAIESHVYPLIVNNLVRRGLNLAAEIGAPLVGAEQIREV